MPVFRFSSFGDKFQAAWTPPATVNLGAKKLCLGVIFTNILTKQYIYKILFYIF
jgi:hypothetical protein